jgi:hypothetical protein
VQQFGGDCTCRAELECTRTSSSCFPPPDCPTSITNVESGAKCIAVTPGTTSSTCLCGCASCAAICDGQGPIIGSDQSMHFDFPANAPVGTRVGIMVRLRGTGAVDVLAIPKEGPSVPVGNNITAPSDFSEILAGTGTGPPGFRPEADRRPVALEIRTQPNAVVEIDCVVPYVAP